MPTPAEQLKAFEAALREQLKARAQAELAADTAVVAQMREAKRAILEILASQPADWRTWQLTQILAQVDAVLEGALGPASASTDAGVRAAWQLGEDAIDKPLDAAGYAVSLQLPALDVATLQALRSFAVDRIKSIGPDVAAAIRAQLSLTTIGGQTTWEAVQAVAKALEDKGRERAKRIVATEVGRAYEVAQQTRMTQAAALVPTLAKQWRRSGKIHSRWQHDMVDGQVRLVHEAFDVPKITGAGMDKLMHPRDPKGSASQTINCGCTSLPFLTDLVQSRPGRSAFTETELKLNPRKKRLQDLMDAAEKAAQAGREPPTGEVPAPASRPRR